MTIVVERVGLTTVQDSGRIGWAHLGVPRSGAADLTSFQLANRLVGNHPHAAALETSGGLSLRMRDDTVVVVTGADCDATVDDLPLARCEATRVRANSIVRLSRMRSGVRAYVAVAGGITASPQLGSLAHDTLGDIVAVPLAVGALLTVGTPQRPPSSVDVPITPQHRSRLRLAPGPHVSLLSSPQRAAVTRHIWRVSETSNRVAVRLTSATLAHDVFRPALPEVLSLPLVRGAVQLAPSGELIVMLADHPTTGGYPVIAVLHTSDLDDLAQRPPTSSVQFDWTSLPTG